MRRIVVGRPDGLRARVRDRLGCTPGLDAAGRAPETPPPAETPPAAAAPPVVDPDPLVGWLRVLGRDEIVAGQVVEVLASGRSIAVADVDGVLYAVDGVCPHAGGPLGDGHLEGSTLTCPWHGWSYDVRTGQCLVDEAVQVERCPVRVLDGSVYVPP